MQPFSFEPAHDDVSRHVATGILSTGVLQTVKVLCQFGSVIILSRLLLPTDFGLFAMVGPVIAFVALFQDLGLSQATVQKADLNHDQVNAFFWINVILGLALSLIVVAISPLVGWYYGDPRVVPLTIAMGALVFVGSLGSQHGAILQRRMQFGVSALIEAVTTVGMLGVSIVWALIYGGYWSLYAGMVAGIVIAVVCSWIASGWRPSFPRRVSGLRGMLRFGAGLTITNFMGFLAGNMDNVLIGHRWGNEALGLYDRAYKLLLFPLQRFAWPLGGIMVPVLSRLMNEPERYRHAFLRVLGQLTLAVWPGILWALIFADLIIPNVLGQQWAGSVELFRPLALVGLVFLVNGSTNWLLTSQGRGGDLARMSIAATIMALATIVIGLPYGAFGVSVALCAGAYIRVPFVWWYSTRKGPVRARDVIGALKPQMASCAVASFTLLALSNVMAGASPWFLIAGSFILAYGVAAATMLFFRDGRETLKQTLVFVRKSFLQFTFSESGLSSNKAGLN